MRNAQERRLLFMRQLVAMVLNIALGVFRRCFGLLAKDNKLKHSKPSRAISMVFLLL
jgi:hypothetical protein